MIASRGTGHRVQIASLPFVFVAVCMMWWRLATGWRPYWYDWVLVTLLLANLALQALALYHSRRV